MEKQIYRNKAFLSYRHVEKDEKLASLLQKKLEHYHIPRELQRSINNRRSFREQNNSEAVREEESSGSFRKGKNVTDPGIRDSDSREEGTAGNRLRTGGVGRIFRDTTDLGARADLTEELRRELEDSEYLIVLCSEAAVGSKWIEREIRYFLQFHDVDKILPVLADGEPDQVLPALFDGVGGKPLHPAACDFRGNRRQALRDELPRLAAALIGCAYDELVNRRQRYEARRLAAMTAGIVLIFSVIAAYYAISRAQIRGILRQRQIAESGSLAVRSETAHSQSLRLDAVRYALDALPEKEGERPVTEQAVLALQKATAAYVPEGNRRPMQTGELKAPQRIIDFQISEFDGTTYVSAAFGNNNVVLWNADSGEEVLDTALQSDVYGRQEAENLDVRRQFLSENLLLRSVNGDLMGIEIPSGKIRWQTREENTSDFRIFDVENGIAVVLATRYRLTDRMPDNVYLQTIFQELQLRSLEDGRLLHRLKKIQDLAGEFLNASIDGDRVFILEHENPPSVEPSLTGVITGTEKDGISGGTQVSGKSESESLSCLSVLNVETGKERILLRESYIAGFQKTADGCLLAAYYNEPDQETAVPLEDMDPGDDGYDICYYDAGENRLYFCCIDMETGETLWETGSRFIQDRQPVLLPDLNILGRRACLISAGTHADVLVQDSGEKLYSIDFPGFPVCFETSEAWGQEALTAILEDGSQVSYLFSLGELLKRDSVFPPSISRIKEAGDSVFLLRAQGGGLFSDDRVIRFGKEEFDPEVSEILTPSGKQLSVGRTGFVYDNPGSTRLTNGLRDGGVYRAGNLFVVLDRENHVHGVDAQTGRVRWSTSVGRNAEYTGLGEEAGVMVFRDYLLSGDEIREMVKRGETVPHEERWIFLHVEDGKIEMAENIVGDRFPGKHCEIRDTAFSSTAMDLLVTVEDKEVWALHYYLQGGTIQAVCLSQKTDKDLVYRLPFISSGPDGSSALCTFSGTASFNEQDYINFLADWKTNKVTEIRNPVPVDSRSLIVWKSDGTVFAVKGQDGRTVLYSSEGSCLEEIPDENGNIKGFGFLKEHFFTIEGYGFQTYFRIPGEKINYLLPVDKENVYDLESNEGSLFRVWELPDDRIFLRYGRQSFVFDAETGAVEAVIDNVIAFNPDTDTMLIIDNAGDLSFAHRYSWKELVKKGRRILGD